MTEYRVCYKDEDGDIRGKPQVITASSEEDAVAQFKEIEGYLNDFAIDLHVVDRDIEPPQATAPRKSGKAKASFWAAIILYFMFSSHFNPVREGAVDDPVRGIGYPFLLAVFSIVLGHKARSEIKQSLGEITGSGFALTGLIISYYLGGAILLAMLMSIGCVPRG